MVGRRARAHAIQVRERGVSDLLRQRQPVLSPRLSRDPEGGMTPVDVAQAEPGHISRTKRQPGKQQKDRTVTAAPPCPTIARPDQALHVSSRKVARKRGKAPLRDAGDRRIQADAALALTDEVTEVHPHRRPHPSLTRRAHATASRQEESAEFSSPVSSRVRSKGSHKPLDYVKVARKRHIGDAAVAEHPLREASHGGRESALRLSGRSPSPKDADAVQVVHEMPDAAHGVVERPAISTEAAARAKVTAKCTNRVLIEVAHRPPLGPGPVPEVRRGVQEALRRESRVARVAEMRGEPIEIGCAASGPKRGDRRPVREVRFDQEILEALVSFRSRRKSARRSLDAPCPRR